MHHFGLVTMEELPPLRPVDAAALAAALQASRADTLQHVQRLQHALPGLQVPQQATLNPPMWPSSHSGGLMSGAKPPSSPTLVE